MMPIRLSTSALDVPTRDQSCMCSMRSSSSKAGLMSDASESAVAALYAEAENNHINQHYNL